MCFGCSKEPSHRDGSFEYPQHMFWLRNKKNNFLLRTLIWGPGLTFSGLDSTKYRKTNSASGLVTCLELVPHPEGGYFREMYRSGSTPMTTKGQTDVNVATRFGSRHRMQLANQLKVGSDRKFQYESLTIAPGRESRRSDCDIRRNCLTTIIWMPTISTSRLFLSINLSGHVHFYHGGAGFEYLLYDPNKRELRRELLGGEYCRWSEVASSLSRRCMEMWPPPQKRYTRLLSYWRGSSTRV